MLGPNITGTAYGCRVYLADPTGVFSKTSSQSKLIGGAEYTDKSLTFNASWDNGIYGTSSTIQPAAIYLLPCIKI